MATPNLMPVQFHGNTLYVIDNNGEPFVPMKPVVDGIGLAWQAQSRKLSSSPERWGITIMVTPSKSGDQKTACIPLRKLPGWLMSIHANKVKRELREKVVQFQNECDDVLWQHWNKNHPATASFGYIGPNAADPAEHDLEWHIGQFGEHKIRAATTQGNWLVCADDLAKIVRQKSAFDLTRHVTFGGHGQRDYFGETITTMTPPAAFAALSKVRTGNAVFLMDYLSRHLFETGAIVAHAEPNRTDYDYARQLFEENPLKFLGPRRWMLSVNQEGEMTARTLSETEQIVDREELRDVMNAYDRLEHFVNRRELRLAFPKPQH
ncbi:phage antirepressor N-terminal domain-containing protein [Salinicola sp. CPA57]|uniref:phage antirepressor N-terminal domain-containing protein n=1 Tax=Salinicola sp. CPA57 TaxID=1949080 RepID=UPI0013004710|nr:phage antirepressor N-terminal domain-containing protein [Salinicola sp. CPA57]